MSGFGEGIRATSTTFPREQLEAILRDSRPFHPGAHVLYPADEKGQHLRGFFSIDAVVHPRHVEWIRNDIVTWIDRRGLDFDVLFAPDQPAVRALADAVAERVGRNVAYWETLPSGRFGSRLVDGSVGTGTRAVVFNGVSHTGRCVGLRLPGFVEGLGGETVAAAVFAKGTVPKVRETEARWGERFYSALQVDVPIYDPPDCPLCKESGRPPVPWTALVAGRMP